jgi:hypothetical protein
VLAIEPRGDDGGDEELRAVGVGAGVGHREETRLGVAQLEAESEGDPTSVTVIVGDRAFADSLLVSELLAVDRLATGAVVVCKCIA